MLTEYEAQKLARDYRQELDVTSSVVWECAVGLLLVVALALFGSGIDLRRDVASDSAPAANRTIMQHDPAPTAETQAAEIPEYEPITRSSD